MKFSVGDRILLKQTDEEGHVIAIISQKMVEVEVAGTVFPVHVEDIDHPYLKWFTEKQAKKKGALPEQLPVERIKERKQRLAKGVYLSFMPVFKVDDIDDIVDVVKVYLLNELPQAVKFVYDVRFSQESEFSHEGTLHGFGNVYLHSVAYRDMNDQPRFHWALTDTSNPEMATAEGVLRIRPAKLFDHINAVLHNNEPTFSYPLIAEFLPKKKPSAPEKFVPVIKPAYVSPSRPSVEAARYEIDLHIEKIIGSQRNFSNTEILKIQIDYMLRYVHLAIVHRQERMIVIHGLGKGKLREEVHAALKKIPEVGRYKNEWSGKYGFGATEIHFKY